MGNAKPYRLELSHSTTRALPPKARRQSCGRLDIAVFAVPALTTGLLLISFYEIFHQITLENSTFNDESL